MASALNVGLFGQPEPERWQGDGTYATAAKLKNNVTFEFSHSLGEIVTALIDAGLHIEFMHEHPVCAWPPLPADGPPRQQLLRLPGRRSDVSLHVLAKGQQAIDVAEAFQRSDSASPRHKGCRLVQRQPQRLPQLRQHLIEVELNTGIGVANQRLEART